ncbi:MAG: hypothetical protein K940chlam7_01459 [Chlamydiae bacterium]|nr:hypothetical protein [Chlamydiota bacterium]
MTVTDKNPELPFSLDASFTDEEFLSLESRSKTQFYRQANLEHRVPLVTRLNSLGMKQMTPTISGPSIISPLMDIATKHEIIINYLKHLRETSRLFTREEFQSFSKNNKWLKKSGIDRLLGSDHLSVKITELGLKYLKVPRKLVVMKSPIDDQSLVVKGWQYGEGLYDLDSDQLEVYAEQIKSTERNLRREEIDELIKLIASANFVDLWPQNFVITKDNIYVIDTEFKSFNGRIEWAKMTRFLSIIKPEDETYFNRQVEEKCSKPNKKDDLNCKGYNEIKNTLRMISNFAEDNKLEKKEVKLKQKLEKIVADYRRVGEDEVGTRWLRPRTFTFPLGEVISEKFR